MAPAEVPFEIQVTVEGTPVGAARDSVAAIGPTAAPPPGAFATEPPKDARAVVDNPIARMFEKGSLVAYLGLFFIGLALNLTPCVYPMIGVTVSIFGARRAAPPLQVFGLASVYVLGIVAMYTTLGVIAALTGSMFGGIMQNMWVLIGIGALFLVLSLSMFGLYELQVPPQLLTRLGGSGATNAAGVFLSGLVVGIFAAPCIGAPVVALLTMVGAKGDPWFGFTSFFVLALGLGAPYLVLGTFSNLLQSLPRSGEWMVWVKKLFGVVLVGVGLFYLSLALAPKLSGWVVPVVLVLGGLYLGFVEKSGAAKPAFRRFKWATGALAILGGVAFVVTAPTKGIAFEEFTPAALESDLAAGKSAMLDFSADWCIPCHELERTTFADQRVIQASRAFRAYKVDLTQYRSARSEELRRKYNIAGVPTVVFLTPSGDEVHGARVVGPLPPDEFLKRMRLATAGAEQAARE
jgi:thiol:disulfide interchange protein DsbD